MHKFLYQVLQEVLSKLLVEQDLCNAKLVCRRWRFIVDEMVGHDLTFTSFGRLLKHLASDDLNPFHIPRPVKDLSFLELYPHIALRNLTIGAPGMLTSDSVSTMIEGIINDIPAFPVSDYPHVLQSISCYEPISSNILCAIGPMINLWKLNLSLMSLANLTSSDGFQNLRKLRALNTLIISDTASYPNFNGASAILPLNGLLDNLCTTKITSVDITYPIVSLTEDEGDSTRSIINFIKRCPKIRNLSIGVHSPNQNFSPPAKGFQYPTNLLDIMEGLGKSVQLISMELRDNHLHSLRPSVQTKSWIVFIKKQTRLQHLKLYLKSSIEFSEDVTKILESNAKTIINLDLSCFPCKFGDTGDVYFVPIDARVLSDCSALETLRLSDKTVNTISLPGSLTYIYVDAMLTNLDAQNIMLSDNVNLKRVELKDSRGGAPKGFGYGVTIETLQEFVKKRMIERLTIYAGSTDEKFPLEGISNGDTVKPKRLRKRKVENTMLAISQGGRSQSLNQTRIDWKLNGRGFYENFEYFDSGGLGDDENYEIPATRNMSHSLYTCDRLISSFH